MARTAGTERYSGRSKHLSDTVLARLYRAAYVHPARFYGDLQRTGIRNWHAGVRRLLRSIPRGGVVLDVGGGARQLPGRVLTLDIQYFPTLAAVADGERLPIRSSSVDGVVAQMVLEHASRPGLLVDEAHRVLRPGGLLYVEVPFLYPVHSSADFRRWTVQGLERLCGSYSRVASGVSMGPFSAISAIARRGVTSMAGSLYSEAVLDIVSGWILAPVKYLDDLIPPSARDLHMVAGAVYFVGRKDAPR